MNISFSVIYLLPTSQAPSTCGKNFVHTTSFLNVSIRMKNLGSWILGSNRIDCACWKSCLRRGNPGPLPRWAGTSPRLRRSSLREHQLPVPAPRRRGGEPPPGLPRRRSLRGERLRRTLAMILDSCLRQSELKEIQD